MGRRRGGRTFTPAALRAVMAEEIGKAMSGAPRTAANPSALPAMTSTPDTFGQLAQLMRAAVGYQARPMARDPRDSGPFGPMHPMAPDPISPARADTGRPEPWLYEYPVAWNIPGQGERLMPWRVLDAAARNIDVIRRCIEIRKSRVRTAPWSWDISPQAIEDAYRADGTKGHDDIAADLRDKYRADINRLTEFWKRPWRAQGLDFGNWVGGVMEGRLKYDAVVIYPRMNLGGDMLLGLEIIDPATVKPLLDYRGSRPEPPFPAYQQLLYGFPRGEWRATSTETVNEDGSKSITIEGAFRADELVYLRENYQLNSPYGYGPTEQALVASRLWMRRQGWLLAEYTDGVTPQLIWELPLDATSGANLTPEQRVEWEASVNDALAGQTSERHRSKVGFPGMVPHLMPSVDERYKPDYDLFILKLMCSFFGVPVSDLGFSETRGLGSKGMHESQAENRADISTGPDLLFATGLVNDVGHQYQGAPAELVFGFTENDGGQDESQAATIRAGEVSTGQKTLNDSRRENSLPVYQFPEADMPFVMGQAGPVFIAGSLAASRRAQGLDENGKPLPASELPPGPGGAGGAQGGDNPGDNGPDNKADKAAAGEPPLCRQVRDQLAGDYPPDATMWVRDADWSGPVDVPPNRLDLDDVKSWDAYGDKAKVDKFRRLTHRAGALKPIVAVTVPGDDRVKVIDGHHRALAAVREGVPVRAYLGRVDAKTGPWTVMHAKQHAGARHGEVDGAAPVSAPPATKSAGPHEPSHEARAEIGAYHRWAAKATTGGRPFAMKYATPDDFPDGVPTGIEFADWVWLGFDDADLVKAYEPWWPRDARGKWIKRGSFAGLEDKIRELHGRKVAQRDKVDALIAGHGDKLRAAEARALTGDRAAHAEAATHRARIAELRDKRDRIERDRKDSAATVLRRHEAEQRKAQRAASGVKPASGLVRVNIEGANSDPSTWSVTGFEGLDRHDAGAATALTRYARRPGEMNARLRTPDKRLSEPTFDELMGRAPMDQAAEAKATARADRHIKAVDRVMARSQLPADTTLYRGASAADLGDLKVGDEFTDTGFASTATSRAVAEHSFGSGEGRVLLTVRAPAGTHAVELHGLGEHEVLLDRGQRFQVIADRGALKGGGHHYEVRVVPKGDATRATVGSMEDTRKTTPATHAQAIRDAYSHAAQSGGWASLADVRDRLPSSMSRADQDAALLHLARTDPNVKLIPWDNQKALTPRERAAAVRYGGTDAHVMGIDSGPAPTAESQIRQAYDQLKTRPGSWVPLADVREHLGNAGVPREEQDRALKELAVTPGVQVIPWDNRLALTRRDREAALRLGGEDNHAIRIDPGPASTGDPVADMRAAYARVAQPGQWASVADLRDQTPHLTRDQQDSALRRIEQMDDANVVPESNQKALSERERAAAVVIGDQPKHMVMIGGASLGGAPPSSMDDQIRRAYAELPKAPGGFVGLADLRERLGGADRAKVDAALQRLARTPGVRVAPFDNVRALTPRDHAAAVHLGVTDRHMISFGDEPPSSMTRPQVGGPSHEVVAAKLRGVASRDEAGRYLDGLKLKSADYKRLGRELGVTYGAGASKARMRELLIEDLAGRRLDAAAMARIGLGKAAEPDPKGQPPEASPTGMSAGAPQPPPDDRWPGWAVDLAVAALVAAALTRAVARGVDTRAVARATARQWPDAAPSTGAVVSWLRDRYGQGLADALTPAVEDALAEGYLIGARSAGAILDAGVDPRNPGITISVDWSHWRPGDARAARQILSADGREVELANLLARAGVTIKGIAEQRLDELAAVLADGLERGDSFKTIATALRGIVANPAWANTVAWTETARAQSAAASEIYRQRGVAQAEWMTAHDQRVCPLCLANDAAGPVDVGVPFPSGDVHPPGHPRCRCALIPVLDDLGKSARAELTGHDQLHHYWTRGEGLAKWADHPHPWTALYHHLLKYLPPGEAKRTAANWFHDVFHVWPGERKGKNPAGPG